MASGTASFVVPDLACFGRAKALVCAVLARCEGDVAAVFVEAMSCGDHGIGGDKRTCASTSSTSLRGVGDEPHPTEWCFGGRGDLGTGIALNDFFFNVVLFQDGVRTQG